MIDKYLSWLNKIIDRDGFLSKNKIRLSHLGGICGNLLEFFESVDKFHIPIVSHEDCIKAKEGKEAMMKRLEVKINRLTSESNTSQL